MYKLVLISKSWSSSPDPAIFTEVIMRMRGHVGALAGTIHYCLLPFLFREKALYIHSYMWSGSIVGPVIPTNPQNGGVWCHGALTYSDILLMYWWMLRWKWGLVTTDKWPQFLLTTDKWALWSVTWAEGENGDKLITDRQTKVTDKRLTFLRKQIPDY